MPYLLPLFLCRGGQRRYALCCLLFYIWETYEVFLDCVSTGNSIWGEGADDALIGDPIAGALGIGFAAAVLRLHGDQPGSNSGATYNVTEWRWALRDLVVFAAAGGSTALLYYDLNFLFFAGAFTAIHLVTLWWKGESKGFVFTSTTFVIGLLVLIASVPAPPAIVVYWYVPSSIMAVLILNWSTKFYPQLTTHQVRPGGLPARPSERRNLLL